MIRLEVLTEIKGKILLLKYALITRNPSTLTQSDVSLHTNILSAVAKDVNPDRVVKWIEAARAVFNKMLVYFCHDNMNPSNVKGWSVICYVWFVE